MTKLKKNRTLPQWQIWLYIVMIAIFPIVLFFGQLFGKKIYVDQHYKKVRAEIVRIKKSTGRGADTKINYYQYNYDNHSYTGKALILYQDYIGDVGDTIVVRCRIEHPDISYYNAADNGTIYN